MSFKVTHKVWLKTEADRIESLLLMPKYWRRAWTPQSLKAELLDPIGLDYSMPEILQLNDELHTRGIVEDVPEE